MKIQQRVEETNAERQIFVMIKSTSKNKKENNYLQITCILKDAMTKYVWWKKRKRMKICSSMTLLTVREYKKKKKNHTPPSRAAKAKLWFEKPTHINEIFYSDDYEDNDLCTGRRQVFHRKISEQSEPMLVCHYFDRTNNHKKWSVECVSVSVSVK